MSRLVLLREACQAGTKEDLEAAMSSMGLSEVLEKGTDGSTAIQILRKRLGDEDLLEVYFAALQRLAEASHEDQPAAVLARLKKNARLLEGVFRGDYDSVRDSLWGQGDRLLKPLIAFIDDQDGELWASLELEREHWFCIYCKGKGEVSLEVAEKLLSHLDRDARVKLLLTIHEVFEEEIVTILSFEEHPRSTGKVELFRYCLGLLDEKDIYFTCEDVPSLLHYYSSRPRMIEVLLERVPEDMFSLLDERGESAMAFGLQGMRIGSSPPLLELLERTPTEVLCSVASDTGATCFLLACRSATLELLQILTERIPEQERCVRDKLGQNALHYLLSGARSRKTLGMAYPDSEVAEWTPKTEYLLGLLPKELREQPDNRGITPTEVAATTPLEKYFQTTAKAAI